MKVGYNTLQINKWDNVWKVLSVERPVRLPVASRSHLLLSCTWPALATTLSPACPPRPVPQRETEPPPSPHPRRSPKCPPPRGERQRGGLGGESKESHCGRQEGKEKSREVDSASVFLTKRAIYNCTR